jgi:hypothetical protein
MNIKTTELNIDIKKYKKLFENYEMFTYSFKNYGKYFYYVSYFRFNKCTGIAILHDGKEVEKEEIYLAFKMMNNFNRIICDTRDQLVPDIKRPISVFQELKSLLHEAMVSAGHFLSEVKEDIILLEKMADLMISFPDELRLIFKELQAIEKEVLDRGYLLEENVNRAQELNFLHCEIMYNQGREQLKGTKYAQRIINQLKLVEINDLNKKIKILMKHLQLFSSEQAVSEIMASQATFEKDEHGNKITFKPGEEGLEEYKQMFYKRVDHILENHIKNYLRNFK